MFSLLGLKCSLCNQKHVFVGAFQYYLRPTKHALDLINYQKTVSGPMASAPISELRLKVLKSQRATKATGGVQGRKERGQKKRDYVGKIPK